MLKKVYLKYFVCIDILKIVLEIIKKQILFLKVNNLFFFYYFPILFNYLIVYSSSCISCSYS